MKNFIFPIIIALVLIGSLIFFNSNSNQTQSKETTGQKISNDQPIDIPTLGNNLSSITLTEYSDFQCPACAAWNQVVGEIVREYGSKIKFQYRHFPLNIHKNAISAAYAAEAAGLQDKFWLMANILFTRQSEWAEKPQPLTMYHKYAQELGLDLEQFNQDYQSQKVKTKVENDLKSAEKLNLASTPSFFINNQYLEIFPKSTNPNENINPVEELRKNIEQAIDAS